MKNRETAVQRYKRRHDLTYPQLAKLWDCPENTLRKIGAGMRPASPRLAKRIERETDGEITAESIAFQALERAS